MTDTMTPTALNPLPHSCGVPLHIVHSVISLDVGGLERIVLDLASLGRSRGHRVTVVCLERPGTLAPQVEAQGATVVSLDKPPGRTPELTHKAASLLADLRPDVLHTHTIGALWYLGPAAKAVNVPVVHTEHIDNVGKAVGRWAKVKMRLLWHRSARYAERFCCVSDDIARSAGRWATVPRAKLETVLNGIDTNRYIDRTARDGVRSELSIHPTARVVGSVGRLNEVKRQDLLLRAVATLGREYTDVQILLVGDGPERVALERLAEKLGIASRTHFVGYQPLPERYLAAMDVFALTSRLEGLPLALLEAWAAGLPVVSSAVGGVPKIVREGENGLLFPSGDVSTLAGALQSLLADPTRAVQMARAGQRLVREQYSLNRMADEYEARYRQVIAARGGR